MYMIVTKVEVSTVFRFRVNRIIEQTKQTRPCISCRVKPSSIDETIIDYEKTRF